MLADIFSKNSKQNIVRNTSRLCNSANEKKTDDYQESRYRTCVDHAKLDTESRRSRKIFGVKYSHELLFYALDLLNFYSTHSLPALRCTEANSGSKFMRKHFIGFFFAVRAMGLGKCAWKCVGAIKGNIFVLFVKHTQRVRRVVGLVPNNIVLRMELKCCFSSVVLKNSRADHRIFHTHTSAPRAQHNFFLSMKNSLYAES